MRYLIILAISSVYFSLSSKEIDTAVLRSKISEYSCSTSWACKTIDRDLSYWTSRDLTKENIKNLALTTYADPSWQCSLVIIKNNCIEVVPLSRKNLEKREKKLLRALNILSSEIGLSDTVFIASFHDLFDQEVPILCYSKSFDKKSIMMPDFEALKGYKRLTKKINQASLLNPWHAKKDLIFWRGGLTGDVFKPDNFRTIPRSRLVAYANKHSNIIDAKFIRRGQVNDTVLQEMEKFDFFGEQLSQEDSLKYKFLIDIDGNSCCFSRTYWALLSNSLVFKVKSDKIQWYYDLLKDKENYVCINTDLSNLENQFNYYLANPQEAQKISKNATDIVKTHLSREAVLAYLYHVINKISIIQKNQDMPLKD